MRGKSELERPYRREFDKSGERYLLTAFEINHHFDASYSLDRGKAWETVEDALRQHATATSTRYREGQIEKTFWLEPTHFVEPDAEAAATAHFLRTRLHVLQRNKPKLLAVLSTDAPDTVRGDLLKVKLRGPEGSLVPQGAVVRTLNPALAWDCCGAKPLTIDLGCTFFVTEFSTQGRHPPTRRYPARYFDQKRGRYVMEDEEYRALVEEQSVTSGRYAGPWWTVLCREGDPDVYTNRQWLHPQYVSKYELQWRSENGRQWNSLGVFRGNDDATTEVAHSFASVRGGLRARYLRVVPIEHHGGGALRVGVYGHALAASHEASGQKRGNFNQAAVEGDARSFLGGGDKVEVMSAPPRNAISGSSCGGLGSDDSNTLELVKYVLNQARTGQGTKYLSRDKKCRRCRCSYCADGRLNHRGCSRRVLRLLVQQEAKDAINEGRDDR